MPINGHASSSHTLFSPSQNGQLPPTRTPVTASSPPSAVRPDGLPAAYDPVQSTPSLSGVSPVDGERGAVPRWQDKAVLRTAAPASSQPAPGTNSERRSASDTGSARSPNTNDAFRRSARLTLRLKPGVKSAMQQLATDAKMSLSEASAKGLEIYARTKIRDQEETLFEPRMQAMMRREIRASDNRHVPFEIKNAIAAEQTRILTADLYKRMLLKDGVALKKINEKLDAAYNLARANVFATRTPKFKNLVAEYWRSTEDQAEVKHKETTGEGEAGTGTPQA